ncbi:DUF1653 domain-containing protein [Candidatus Dependentiae bacterium]|nr:DUF1653 domain-containing protein [Candidatus Dependentiae bacterium]MCC7415259.1 DUF1653 domain-containing protein [Campylobacterota bacterium]
MFIQPKKQDELLSVGIYKHYKNNYYLVLCVAQHTETGEKLVVYQSLYDDCALWSRPLEMFVSDVEYNGVVQPRFKKVGESHEAHKYINVLFSKEPHQCSLQK